jgi:hypothetical protein
MLETLSLGGFSMSQHMRVKLPGTLYFIDLTLDSTTNTGKVLLERKAVEAQKTLSDLSPHNIQGVLLDLLDAQGLHPNPRIISRVLEDITETEETGEVEVVEVAEESKVIEEVESVPEVTSVVEMKAEVPAKVDAAANSPLLKFKDILAAASFQMSQLDSLLKESTNAEVESAMKSLQNLLMQAKNIINEIVSN